MLPTVAVQTECRVTPPPNHRFRDWRRSDGTTNPPSDDWTTAKRKRAAELLAAADWNELAPRLGEHAALSIRSVFRSRVGPNGAAPGGRTPLDFVDDVVTKFFHALDDRGPSKQATGRAPRGMRRWDPDKRPLLHALCDAIDSEILNHSFQIARRKTHHALLQHEPPIQWNPAPADLLLQHAEDRAAWLAELSARPLAQAIVRSILDSGIFQPAELAVALGVTQSVVYNEMKWLRRWGEPIHRRYRARK